MIASHGGIRSCLIVTLCSSVQACGGTPPAYSSDQDDAAIYADVAAVARRVLAIDDRMPVHSYLAVTGNDSGVPAPDLSTFEYEPSTALEILEQRDSSIVLCEPNAQGICRGRHVVFSQITRVGERDAVVIVREIRGPASVNQVLVKLRYGRNGWGVSGYDVIALDDAARAGPY